MNDTVHQCPKCTYRTRQRPSVEVFHRCPTTRSLVKCKPVVGDDSTESEQNNGT